MLQFILCFLLYLKIISAFIIAFALMISKIYIKHELYQAMLCKYKNKIHCESVLRTNIKKNIPFISLDSVQIYLLRKTNQQTIVNGKLRFSVFEKYHFEIKDKTSIPTYYKAIHTSSKKIKIIKGENVNS